MIKYHFRGPKNLLSRDGQGTGRDNPAPCGTIPRKFVPVPQSSVPVSVPRDTESVGSGFGSRSRSWGFAGQDRDPGIAPGQPPIRARDSRDWDKNLRDRQESRSVTVRSSCPGILCDANRIQSRCLWIQFDAFKSSLVPRSSRDDFLSSFL